MEIAVMIFKILAISYLFILCSASAQVKRQAIAAETYILQDSHEDYISQNVPKDKTVQKKDTDPIAPIQYAPLYTLGTRLKSEMEEYHRKNFEESVEGRKKQLEPNLDSYPQSALPYVPGHNIEILQSVNRSPGILEYRSISHTTEASAREERLHEKVNFHREFSNSKTRPQEPKEILPTNQPADHYTGIVKVTSESGSNEKYKPEPNIIDQQLLRNHETLQDIHELTKQIEAQRIVGYPKMNALLLNLARVYSPRVTAASHGKYLKHPKNDGISPTSHYEKKLNWKTDIVLPEPLEY